MVRDTRVQYVQQIDLNVPVVIMARQVHRFGLRRGDGKCDKMMKIETSKMRQNTANPSQAGYLRPISPGIRRKRGIHCSGRKSAFQLSDTQCPVQLHGEYVELYRQDTAVCSFVGLVKWRAGACQGIVVRIQLTLVVAECPVALDESLVVSALAANLKIRRGTWRRSDLELGIVGREWLDQKVCDLERRVIGRHRAAGRLYARQYQRGIAGEICRVR